MKASSQPAYLRLPLIPTASGPDRSAFGAGRGSPTLIGRQGPVGRGPMAVAITRRELGAGDLRREAGRCRDAKAARRMLALALVLEGSPREAAARAAGTDRQTLRDR